VIFQSSQSGQNYYQLRVGPFRSQSEANDSLIALRFPPYNFGDSFVVVMR